MKIIGYIFLGIVLTLAAIAGLYVYLMLKI